MAKVIEITLNLDYTGSYGGRDIPCWRFDGEPSTEQQIYCYNNHISMEWANGSAGEWEGMHNPDGSWNTGEKSGGHIPTLPMSGIEKSMYVYMAFLLLLITLVWFITR